ncbi:SOS response-associated peptidase [Reyranella sp.]|uniref:SOS response-associated peptidase n=1 Tax=Reyranella sp. TaxID=1929291 RepID=UPI003BA9143C
MCNLYTVRKSRDEVAKVFRARMPPVEPNLPDDILPGGPGLVVRDAEGGERVLQSMVWGFPMRFATMKPGSKPRPVNNIADVTKFTWKRLAETPRSRCLIPLTRFAEPEGPKGARTRTWIAIRDQPVAAWGGLWRTSDEWGPVYSGVMTDANDAIRPLHDRMPVLLHAHEFDEWLHGSFDDIVAFQKRTFPSDLIEIAPTADLWVPKKAPPPAQAAS